MPKPLYGGNKNRSKRSNDSGPLRADAESSSGEWITLSSDATMLSEDSLFDATLESLMEAVAVLDPTRFDAPSGMREAVAGSFIEAATTRADLDCEVNNKCNSSSCARTSTSRLTTNVNSSPRTIQHRPS